MQLNTWCTGLNNSKLHIPPQNSKDYHVPFGKGAKFVNHLGVADIKMQPKIPKFLLDMRYFCNFSLVSLGIRPRSPRCAERTRKGEGRWSRPPKAALERSYIRPRIPVPRIAYFGRDKKLLTKYLTPKKDFIYIYIYLVARITLKLSLTRGGPRVPLRMRRDYRRRLFSGDGSTLSMTGRQLTSRDLTWP